MRLEVCDDRALKRTVITGSPDQVVHTIEDFRRRGLEHLALSFPDVRLFKDETPDLLKQMRLFASEIMPAFRSCDRSQRSPLSKPGTCRRPKPAG